MKCPIDDSPLSVSARDGVEIDFCPQCRGVWLDRGELDKIIDRASAAINPGQLAPPPQLHEVARHDDRRDHDGYDDRKKRRKRSFLDDLFDFD